MGIFMESKYERSCNIYSLSIKVESLKQKQEN